MTRKFKKGDRVKIKSRLWLSRFASEGVDFVGTVVDYDYEEDGFVLVKFDNFTNGHSGIRFYSKEGIKHDPNNQQHLYVHEKVLCLLEDNNMAIKKKIDFSVLKRPTVVCVNCIDIESIVNSDFVKSLREKNNYTQVRLANIIGVSKKTVEKWEQGANPIASPSARLMFLLEKYPQLAEEFVISNVYSKKGRIV